MSIMVAGYGYGCRTLRVTTVGGVVDSLSLHDCMALMALCGV